MKGFAVAACALASVLAPVLAHAQVKDIVFPVQGQYSFRDDFQEPRDGGAREHLGIDIIADKMTPLLAAVDGTISFIAIPQASWGYSISIKGEDGYTYRYLHMNNDSPGTDDGVGGISNAYAPGISRGARVSRGQVVGWVGDSGNAEATVSHLHFEIRDPSRAAINPYDTLVAASDGKAITPPIVTPAHGSTGGIDEEQLLLTTQPLSEGTTDPKVELVHQQLILLGLYSGDVTQTYNSQTREAIRKFQNSNAIAPTGLADAQTQRILAELSSSKTSVSPSTETLREGMSGDSVRALQSRLKELGFFTGEVTAYFGPITKKAVSDLQRARGIEPVGYVGPQTRAALQLSNPAVAAALSAPAQNASQLLTNTLRKGMRGEEVRLLQQKLTEAEAFAQEATGYFGVHTEAAVVAFQSKIGVEPVGYVGPLTRAALNAL